MINSSYMIIGEGRIILKYEKFIDKKISFNKKNIEKFWQKYKLTNNKIFNGDVLSFVNFTMVKNEIIVNCTFRKFADVITSRAIPQLGLHIKPIGVSGMLIIKENDKNYVLFSTRSLDVTDYPGYLELVPSGHIDKKTLRNDGKINYLDKLKEEFVEETGLSLNLIDKMMSICLILDTKIRIYDVCCLIKISANRKNIIKEFKKNGEYTKPDFVLIDNLNGFIEKNNQKIVPTSLGMLSCFKNKIIANNDGVFTEFCDL